MVWERLKDRNNVIALLLALIAVVLVFRLVQLQIVNGEYYSDLSENKRIRRIAVEAPRGLFLDRYGREIAGNRPGYVVEVVKTEIVQETISYVAQELVGILDSNGEHIRLDFAIGDDPLRFKLDSGKEAEWKDKYEIPREYDAAQALAFLREKHGIAPEMTDELALKALAILHKIGEQSYLAYQPLEIARDVSALTVAQIEERHLDLPGINVEVKPIRYYKEGNLASHVLGYLGSINHEELESLEDKGYTQNDIIGKSGLERVLEEELKGISGARQVEVNSVGRLISTLGERPSIPGSNVFLTLDSRLQQTAERALEETMEKIQAGEMGKKYPNAKSGAAVAIDVNTGEVLAMASYPSYDPNLFTTGISSEDWGALNPQSNDPLEPRPLYNNAIQAAVPPGSTFKMVVAVAALQEKIITPKTVIVDKGVYRVIPGASPACWIWNQNRTTHGPENVVEAIKDSCNYFFYEVGRLAGIERIEEYARMLGLGQRTGIELPGESAGIVAGPTYKTGIWKNVIKRYMSDTMNVQEQEMIDDVFSLLGVQFSTWTQMRRALEEIGINETEHINKLISYINASRWTAGQTLSAAIGQGEHMYTPLQMANYIATIANGGTRYKPHLIKKIYDQQKGEYRYNKPEVLDRIEISPENLKAVFDGMLAVTKPGGTAASSFRDTTVNIAGKTGTAQNPGYDGYAWFVGFAPYEDPQIAVAVVIFQGGSGGYSTPVVKAIIEEYLKVGSSGTVMEPGNVLAR
ncbi:MAG: penicillin-binding protein 2 [Firmicutes bacterium]|nr:penicillin-binding protein 2 [Bacillota bacterium]MDD3297836.1 penicillin-binding protein 2 [Bacillota bacterium]MDD3851267.1 penicillin-binding protein 2 [Bacillota bacterium]MDD4706959.1 penicillin-binding protein 2 [Bacillota bacterium]